VRAAARQPPSCTRRRPVRCALGTVAPGETVTGRARVQVLIPGALHSVLYVLPHPGVQPHQRRVDCQPDQCAPRTARGSARQRPGARPGRRAVQLPRDRLRTRRPSGSRRARLHPHPELVHQPARPGTFRYHGMRCHDYPALQSGQPGSFTVTAVPAARGPVTLRGLAAAVGTRRVARDRTTARISIPTCGSVASRLRC
jgi:hypothetical protein